MSIFGKIIAKFSLFVLHVRVIKNKYYLNGVAAIIKYAERSEGDFYPKECLLFWLRQSIAGCFLVLSKGDKKKIRFFC